MGCTEETKAACYDCSHAYFYLKFGNMIVLLHNQSKRLKYYSLHVIMMELDFVIHGRAIEFRSIHRRFSAVLLGFIPLFFCIFVLHAFLIIHLPFCGPAYVSAVRGKA